MSANKFRAIDITYIAMFTAILAICSWISIPAAVPFTLQTFAVFLALNVLGGRRGFFTVLTFLLLGAIGIPVFNGFKGGIGVLFGSTGGYLLGFLLSALVYWFIVDRFGRSLFTVVLSFTLGLLVCYAFGTAWFMVVYGQANGAVGVATALGWCVIPFIIPDVVKIALAVVLGNQLKKYTHL